MFTIKNVSVLFKGMHETISYVNIIVIRREINDCKMGKNSTNDGVLTFSIEQC